MFACLPACHRFPSVEREIGTVVKDTNTPPFFLSLDLSAHLKFSPTGKQYFPKTDSSLSLPIYFRIFSPSSLLLLVFPFPRNSTPRIKLLLRISGKGRRNKRRKTKDRAKMSTGELLSIEPLELKFPFELKKQISCSLQLSNKTDSYVAFKVKTTNPKKYCVRPNAGVVLPRSTCDIIVTMQAQKEAPADMQCKDKFLLQSVKAPDGSAAKDITAEMFNKEAGHQVEETKLKVVYVAPPQPPSPVPEGSEEGSSPRGSVSDNGHVNGADPGTWSNSFLLQALLILISWQAKSLISKLTEEKNNAIQQNNKLRQELVS
ncbi:unnamed protein product [Linum tenue]|uniref:MSP domain-containing protein n=1 Tax=Linum tenue TaxID=586396 RepID=A0AAV0K783_9ROSI|nr:unnamed protein product [Linum tenue]